MPGHSHSQTDVVIVGAGIVGLAHAVEALKRGLSVLVVERDDRPVGASVRNFGHGCVTGQLGTNQAWALAARERWHELSREAGFWIGTGGALIAARSADELVVAAIAAWVARQPGADIWWSTSMLGLDGDVVRTSRGESTASRTVICVGHDVDRLFPDIAEVAGMQRCALHMLRVANPGGRPIAPAVLTGTSLLRYPAFKAMPAAAALHERYEREHADLMRAGLNLMFTQLPGGDLTIGDTHAYATTHDPYGDEAADDLVLREIAKLLGAEQLDVRQRWRGVYASAPSDTLIAAASPTATVVSVTSGVGMTIAHGLAATVLDDVLA